MPSAPRRPLPPSIARTPPLALLLLLLTPSAHPASGDPALALTSFLPVHSLTRSVAGSRAIVENWLPPGADPHEFQFQPRDLRRLRQANLLIIGGLGLEGWREEKLRDTSGNPRLRLIDASANLPADALIHTAANHPEDHADDTDHDPGHDHHGGGPNPHFWLDPLLAAHAVTNILNALTAADPAGRDAYARGAAETVARLEALHAEYIRALAPVRNTPFITFHNAFPYLARRYGLRLVGVVESNAAEEPTPRELARLAALVRQENARILFVDGPPSRLARRLTADLGLTVATLETLETGPFEPTAYEDGMRRNLKTLVRTLSSASRPRDP